MVMLDRTTAREWFKKGIPIQYYVTPQKEVLLKIQNYKVTTDFVNELKREGILKRQGDWKSGILVCCECKKQILINKKNNKNNLESEKECP